MRIRNVAFLNLYTSLDPAVESRGGCLYVDSIDSKLDIKID